MSGSRQVKIEILGDAKSAQSAFKTAESAGGGFGAFIAKVGSGLATFDLAVEGLGRIGSAIGGMVGAALEGESAMAQTEAAIKSTGGAAGLSAQQIADYADALEQTTPFSAEAIQQGENLLLTFTNIGKNVFPQTTEAMLDMAARMGTDASGAAIQLGKALNDPVSGITALTRVGVTFTDAQKDMITSMVEAGDVEGAQKVILAELNKEFGGSAKAAGETLAGKIEILKNRFGNLQETVGAALIPALIKLSDKALPLIERGVALLAAKLPILLGFFGRLASHLAGPLMAAFVLVRDGVLTFAQAIQGNWTDDANIRPLHRAIGLIGTIIHDQVIPAVERMAAFFTGTVIPAFHQVMGVVGQVVAAFQGGGGLAGALERLSDLLGPLAAEFLAWAGQVLVMLVNQVGKWAGALLDWIAPQIPPLLAELGKILLAIGAWALNVALPAILAQLAVWGQALIDWIGPRIGPMLAALGELLAQLSDWLLNVGLPLLAANLQQWGAAFIAWVQPQIAPLLEQLGALLSALGDWLISTALPEIGAKLLEWGTAFVAWVAPQIPPLLVELGNLLLALGDWLITTALPEIASKLLEWGLAFVSWVAPQIPPLLGELGALLVALGDWLLTTALPEIVTKLAQWGAEFVAWVAPQIPPLLAALGDLLLALGKWLLETALPEIVKYLGKWAEKFVGWVADVISDLPGKLDGILTAIGGWIDDSLGALGDLGGRIGDAIGSGIKSGIDYFIGLAEDVINSLIDAYNSTVGKIPGVPNLGHVGGGGGSSGGGGPNFQSLNLAPNPSTTSALEALFGASIIAPLGGGAIIGDLPGSGHIIGGFGGGGGVGGIGTHNGAPGGIGGVGNVGGGAPGGIGGASPKGGAPETPEAAGPAIVNTSKQDQPVTANISGLQPVNGNDPFRTRLLNMIKRFMASHPERWIRIAANTVGLASSAIDEQIATMRELLLHEDDIPTELFAAVWAGIRASIAALVPDDIEAQGLGSQAGQQFLQGALSGKPVGVSPGQLGGTPGPGAPGLFANIVVMLPDGQVLAQETGKQLTTTLALRPATLGGP